MDTIKATNPTNATGGRYSNSIKDNESITFSTDITYVSNASPMVQNSITLKANKPYTYAQLLAHNNFIYNPMVKLPQGVKSTTS